MDIPVTKMYLYVGIATLVVLVILVIVAILNIRHSIKIVKEIAEDTLKRADKTGKLRWSRTSLTMFSAWVVSIYMALLNMVKTGFNMEVFLILVGVALGSKIADGFTKKIDPTISASGESGVGTNTEEKG